MNIVHSLMFMLLLAARPGGKTIEWSEGRKLTMNDFQMVAHHRNTNEFSGQTSSGIEPEYSTDGKTLTYKVPALFDKNTSWMVYFDKKHSGDLDVEWMNHRAGTYGLAHEQKHFDITELYARKIRRMFCEEVNRGNLNRVDNMLQHYLTEWEEFQDRYDSETQHSLDTTMQQKWDAKIERMLHELSNYSASEGEVRLSSGSRS